MSKKFALKAINDDYDTCSCCGRDHLKRVAWLVEKGEDGDVLSDPFPVGTTCAAKMLSWTHSKMNTRAKNFEYEVQKQREILIQNHPSTKKANEILEQINALKIYGTERFEHPLFKEMRNLKNEAHQWAQEQEVLIDLN